MPSPGPRPIFALLGLVLLLEIAYLVHSPRQGYVTVDLGAVYLQTMDLAAGGAGELPIGPLLRPVLKEYFPWRLPGLPTGPIQHWGSFEGSWFVEKDGRFLVVYPFTFAAVSAMGYRLMGEAGLFVLPVLSALIVIWATFLLSVRLGATHPMLPAVTVGLASPLLLYAVLVWGHAPAVATASLAFLALSQTPDADGRLAVRAALSAGVCLGATAAFRNEGFLLLAVTASSILVLGPQALRRRLPLVAVGALLAVLPAAVHNFSEFGSMSDPTQASRALSMVAAAPAVTDRLGWASARVSLVLRTLAESLLGSENLIPVSQGVFILLLTLPVLPFAVTLNRARASSGFRLALFVSAMAGLLYLPLAVAVRPQLVTGLFLASPFLSLSVAYVLSGVPIREAGLARLFAVIATLFVLGCSVRGSPGWQWGGRYYLPALPLLAIFASLAWEGFARLPGFARAARIAGLMWIGAGIAMSAIAWRDLKSEQAFRQDVEQSTVAANRSDAVAFDHWWFAWENAPLARDRELFYVDDAACLGRLLDYLASTEAHRVTLITRAPAAALSEYVTIGRPRGWTISKQQDITLPNGTGWHSMLFTR